MAAIAVSAKKIFKEIEDDVKWLRAHRDEQEKKIVHLANNIATVRDKQLYKERIDPKTKKPYTSFTTWLAGEVQESRASVYRFLSVRQYLSSVPNETLEEIGNSKCFELAKIGREKKELLPRFIREVKKNPTLQLVSLRNMVENSIAGGAFDSGQYESITFTVKVEDMIYIHKGLAVMQAMDGVKNPETAAGRGVHLVSLMQNYLAGKEESNVLKNLEEAGAFENGVFKIEE